MRKILELKPLTIQPGFNITVSNSIITLFKPSIYGTTFLNHFRDNLAVKLYKDR